jgi:hypothetical protein
MAGQKMHSRLDLRRKNNAKSSYYSLLEDVVGFPPGEKRAIANDIHLLMFLLLLLIWLEGNNLLFN